MACKVSYLRDSQRDVPNTFLTWGQFFRTLLVYEETEDER